MLTVEEAKQLLFSQIQRSEIVEIPIDKAFGNVLAQDLYSPIDLPLFDQSSVDGYAIAFDKIEDHAHFEIIEEIKAGDYSEVNLRPGQGVRIFTGAMVPATANLVVMQEFVNAKNEFITLGKDFKPGNFIRKQGTQIKEGELALEKGVYLNPGVIGFISSLGIAKVKIFKKPIVSIIVTGNEIVKPGNELDKGQIYESNSYALQAALRQQNIEPKHILNARDTRVDLDEKIALALKNSDIVLLTGGISVGEYDLVFDALKDVGAETIFYKVAQRPGKPLWTGKIGNKMVFALPGNPASVMVCFYEYVYPAIRMMRGFNNTQLQSISLKLLKGINDPGERASFLRAKLIEDGVMPLEKQDSGMMMSFAGGNALIYIPKERNFIAKDEMVEVHLLPFEG